MIGTGGRGGRGRTLGGPGRQGRQVADKAIAAQKQGGHEDLEQLSASE